MLSTLEAAPHMPAPPGQPRRATPGRSEGTVTPNRQQGRRRAVVRGVPSLATPLAVLAEQGKRARRQKDNARFLSRPGEKTHVAVRLLIIV